MHVHLEKLNICVHLPGMLRTQCVPGRAYRIHARCKWPQLSNGCETQIGVRLGKEQYVLVER